ncbi:MAG: hypothetical protein JJU05_00705 [Verrucomicrobia bacterium]|nr:hypothetical protein [Verrucomicrobiota bacterium]MCH8526347.1 hypothetical protein [Kiritimatiellia bacterium]
MKPEHQWIALRNALIELPGEPISIDENHSIFTYPSGKEVEWRFGEKLSTPFVEGLLKHKSKKPLLLFSPYISPTFAERLQRNGVFFVDETGNAYLEWPGYYLFISRDVPKNLRPGNSQRKAGKDFSPSALKLIYLFLTDTNKGVGARVNHTVRQLNAVTGISTGSISNTMDSLKAQNFLEEREPGVRRLAQREKLFERWVEDYTRKLRPKLVVEHYRLPHPGWASELVHTDGPGKWGGEVAGSRLTGHLVPETVTLYTENLPANFIVKNDLRKDPAGRVEILRPFTPMDLTDPAEACVHPLLVYSDLMASEIDRNLETAKRIYEKYLRPLATSD